MDSKDAKHDLLLFALILILVLYIAYWVGYSNYKYSSFQEGWFDVGAETFAFYYHVNWGSSIGGLQFASFAEHVDPFELFLLPIFALYENPITLFVVQDVALAAAALVIYLIGKDVIKNRYVGFALALAFLLNPGIRGITTYDFHPEAFIPIFYILCFYLYMRSRTKLFVVSYVLLISIIETAIPIGATLLLGLLVYELFESRSGKEKLQKNKNRIYYIAVCALITILFFTFYSFSINYLQASYASGNYKSMPPFFKVANFYGSQFKTIFSPPSPSYSEPLIIFIVLAAVGIVILVFGFGQYALKVPLITLILISPWLFEVLVLHNPVFPTLYNEYYAYAIGGAVVAACLGIMKTIQRKGMKYVKPFSILLVAVIISGYTLLFTPINQANNPLVWLSPQNSTLSSINNGISLINNNATVMAQQSIAAHMYGFRNLEMPPDLRLYAFTQNGFTSVNVSFYRFMPDYIVLDEKLADYSTMNNSEFDVYTYMADNYTLYYSNGGLEIYKRADN